jgi:hypothetical protein
MTALLAWFLTNPTIIGILSAVVAVISGVLWGRVTGAKAERNKQAVKDAAAATEGQKIDDAVAGRAPDDNRARLDKWAKS